MTGYSAFLVEVGNKLLPALKESEEIRKSVNAKVEELSFFLNGIELNVNRSLTISVSNPKENVTRARSDYSEAAKMIGEIKKQVNEIDFPYLRVSLQERVQEQVVRFVAAMCYDIYLYDDGYLGGLFRLKDFELLFHGGKLEIEAYLMGVIKFCHLLDKYSLTKAAQGDDKSVKKCFEMVEQIFEWFLGFSFRNGELRRQFDSLKYVSKNLQDRIYDFSLLLPQGPVSYGVTLNDVEPAPKRMKNLDSSLQRSDFDEFAKALEEEDNYIEAVTKQTRNIQKNAKRAIFAIHGSRLKEAEKLFLDSVAIVKEIPVYKPNPEVLLNMWPYTGCLEELIEGFLLLNWHQASATDSDTLNQCSSGEIKRWILPDEMLLTLDKVENILGVRVALSTFLGALSDLTGEIGRLGVLAATKKNVPKLLQVLETMETVDISVSTLYQHVPVPSYVEKKRIQMEMNARKMRNVLYEQTVRRSKSADVEENVETE